MRRRLHWPRPFVGWFTKAEQERTPDIEFIIRQVRQAIGLDPPPELEDRIRRASETARRMPVGEPTVKKPGTYWLDPETGNMRVFTGDATIEFHGVLVR